MSDDHVLDAALQMIDGRDAVIAALRAQVVELREALTPSLETKAAYVSRFEQQDPDDETVPWSTIKEIMAAILARAEMSGWVK